MSRQSEPDVAGCPVTVEAVRAQAKSILDGLLQFCETSPLSFGRFEAALLVRLAVLGCCLLRLFLTAHHHRLDVEPFLADGKYRRGEDYAERTFSRREEIAGWL